MKQARELAWLLLPEPMNVKEIQREARRCFGWMPGRVVQILAAGEGIYFYFKQCAPDEMGQWCLSENMKGVPV